LQVLVPESQVPTWPPAMVGQSLLMQQPVDGMQIIAAAQFLGVVPPQE
jgi:hypothetical protein